MRANEVLSMNKNSLRTAIHNAYKDAIDHVGRPHMIINNQAKLSSVGVNSLYNRMKMPNLDTFVRICAALGKSPNEVLKWGE